MPPKRKAMAESSTNKRASAPRQAKAAKTSAKATAPKESAKSKGKNLKYCDANTLSKKPKYMNLQWPNLHEFIDDKDQDMPKNGELVDEYCDRVSDLGIPVSEDGMKVCDKLDKEYTKRDQDVRGMHIYNDWNGWGMSEVMSNLLKDFNRDIFKKTVSPFKKWAYVEGWACFLKTADLMYWIGNEDGGGVKEIIDMLGVMTLTVYDMLSEHDLLKQDSPDAEIKNIGLMSMLILEFIKGPACDFDIGWGREIVRLLDNAGMDLKKIVRKQVAVSEKDIKEYRQAVKDNIQGWMAGYKEGCEENMYKKYAEMKNWTPKDDVELDSGRGPYWPADRMWYRWDWAIEFKPFLKEHPGGVKYDLTKLGKREREEYTLGTKAFGRRIGEESEDIDSD